MNAAAAPIEKEKVNSTGKLYPLTTYAFPWKFACGLSLSFTISLSLRSQTITSPSSNSALVQAGVAPPGQTLEIANRGLIQTNIAARTNQSRPNSPAKPPVAAGVSTQLNFTAEEMAKIQARGFVSQYANLVQPITNRDGQVIPIEDVAGLKGRGWTDEDIANTQVSPLASPSPQQTQSITNSRPTILKNTRMWMDNLFGLANATMVADIISAKQDSLQFRCYGKDYDYSGNYTVMLNTPRQHKYPFPAGFPQAAKFLILGDVGGDVFVLQNVTIWERSDGFINAVASGKEWIYSGGYTVQD